MKRVTVRVPCDIVEEMERRRSSTVQNRETFYTLIALLGAQEEQPKKQEEKAKAEAEQQEGRGRPSVGGNKGSKQISLLSVKALMAEIEKGGRDEKSASEVVRELLSRGIKSQGSVAYVAPLLFV